MGKLQWITPRYGVSNHLGIYFISLCMIIQIHINTKHTLKPNHFHGLALSVNWLQVISWLLVFWSTLCRINTASPQVLWNVALDLGTARALPVWRWHHSVLWYVFPAIFHDWESLVAQRVERLEQVWAIFEKRWTKYQNEINN